MKRICVFAGSSAGARPGYGEAAESLGRTLAEHDIVLVYGGSRIGLMGFMADAALNAGGRVIGVMPSGLVTKEVAHTGLTAFHEVGTMHERKALMIDLSDGFIALPGGWGTLDELFEILTWAQLGLHRKPCGLLNAGGYFDPLLQFIDHTVAEGFVQGEYRTMLAVSSSAPELLDELAGRIPPVVEKGSDRQPAR